MRLLLMIPIIITSMALAACDGIADDHRPALMLVFNKPTRVSELGAMMAGTEELKSKSGARNPNPTITIGVVNGNTQLLFRLDSTHVESEVIDAAYECMRSEGIRENLVRIEYLK